MAIHAKKFKKVGSENGRDIHLVHFDSVSECVHESLSPDKYEAQTSENQKNCFEYLKENTGGRFWGGKTLQGLRDELVTPDMVRLKSVKEIQEAITFDMPIGKRRKVHRNLESGDSMDPIAWASRRMNGWQQVRRVKRERPKPVRIGINVVCSCAQNAEHLLYRGAAVAALADKYTRQGCPVQIDAFFSVRGAMNRYPGWQVVSCRVKDTHQTINMPWLAFVSGEIAFMRSVMFAATWKAGLTRVCGSLGTCAELPNYLAKGFDMVIDWHVNSLTKAKDFVKKQQLMSK